MGEMASSVAHELNQPLTAINNYCNGMVSRIKAQPDQRGGLAGRAGKNQHARRTVPVRSSSASAPS
jgi:signal transduction histidine kinase